MKVRRIFAIAIALGMALIPAAASASAPASTYTKGYAGYYAKQPAPKGCISAIISRLR